MVCAPDFRERSLGLTRGRVIALRFSVVFTLFSVGIGKLQQETLKIAGGWARGRGGANHSFFGERMFLIPHSFPNFV